MTVKENREEASQVLRIAAGEVICVAIMLGIYALLGRFNRMVLIGALLGGTLAILNFLFLSIAVGRAADRAQRGEAAKAALAVQSSSVYRFLGMAVILILAFRAGVCDPLAALLPLLFVQVVIQIAEFFRGFFLRGA